MSHPKLKLRFRHFPKVFFVYVLAMVMTWAATFGSVAMVFRGRIAEGSIAEHQSVVALLIIALLASAAAGVKLIQHHYAISRFIASARAAGEVYRQSTKAAK